MFIQAHHKEKVRSWLSGLQERIDWMAELNSRSDDWEKDLTWKLAAERAIHTSVEYMTDIGDLIIDALVMRDPGGYGDILKVLVEEHVLTSDWFTSFEGVFELRARLIRDHANISPLEIKEATHKYGPLMPEFVERITSFVQL